jgi:hypothetical protein
MVELEERMGLDVLSSEAMGLFVVGAYGAYTAQNLGGPEEPESPCRRHSGY